MISPLILLPASFAVYVLGRAVLYVATYRKPGGPTTLELSKHRVNVWVWTTLVLAGTIYVGIGPSVVGAAFLRMIGVITG